MTTFYKNYVQQCANKNVSLSAAAEAVGLSRTSPNGWKKGKQPSDVTLQKLSDYFGCSISELTCEIEQKEKPTIHSEPLPKITQDLLADIQKLNLDEQQAMWAVVQAIISKRGEDK